MMVSNALVVGADWSCLVYLWAVESHLPQLTRGLGIQDVKGKSILNVGAVHVGAGLKPAPTLFCFIGIACGAV